MMSAIINIGLSTSILILFFIVIGVGYVFIDEGRRNIENMNSTINQFIDKWNEKQVIDNARFNMTFTKLDRDYSQAISNQHLILKALNQSEFNGNLTFILLNETRDQSNKALVNQETYFKPYLNESFSRIYDALNITR